MAENKEQAMEQLNKTYLSIFEEAVKDETKVEDVRYYINEYLLCYDIHTIEEGCTFEQLNGYFGDHYINKCTTTTAETLKVAAENVRQFYELMAKEGKISKEAYDTLADVYSYSLEDWLYDAAKKNDPAYKESMKFWNNY